MGQVQTSLVSIVTPVYNAERFIEETVKSVQSQTYDNWELILVDDASSDASVEIIKKLQKSDDRIKLIESDVNSGAAKSRNMGTVAATGRYIAFLDADDFWHQDKLEKQLSLMNEHGHLFTFTSYAFVNSEGVRSGTVVNVPAKVSFIDYLKSNIIWTSTVMVDLNTVSKRDLIMEDLSYGEDAKTWLNLLSKYGTAYGVGGILAFYRRGGVTLSSNKIKAVVDKFTLYMSMSNLSILRRVYYFIFSTLAAVGKRI